MKLIENHQLEAWARSSAAKDRFPHWIRALISAVIQPDKLRIPSGDATWLPGYDGFVVNKEPNQYVPAGNSVWELSTESDFRGKANGDYAKRSNDKSNASQDERQKAAADRTHATFVFVTPFLWKDKATWVTEKKAEKIWKDVIVVDGEDLKRWIESADAVSLQLAAEIRFVPEIGLQTPDDAWDEWSHRTERATSENLIVAGRSSQEADLVARLAGSPSTFTVRGHSPSEAWAFALAAIRRIQPEDARLNVYSRTIVAANEEVASRLTNHHNLIVILKEAGGQVSGNLSSKGCHVIVPDGNDSHSGGQVIQLDRPTHRQFTEALVQIGLSQEDAEKMSRACGLSVTILQRQWPHATYARPDWADGSTAPHLLPALFAGRWDERVAADRDILRDLAGVGSYEEVQDNLHKFLSVDDPPLKQIGDMWSVVAPIDAFQLMARHIAPSHLGRFEKAFRKVFSVLDPRVEADPDQWIYLKETPGSSSGWLRSGIAESLLLIAERGKEAGLRGTETGQNYAARLVRGLPGLSDDWRTLASIRDQYARLMEAAPDPLLDSLEHLLEAKSEEFKRIFAEASSPLWGGAMHTGMLWGLELLAWGPEYFPRVTRILAKLAALDPGGNLANRPINSLRDILLWWHPGTNATTSQRMAVIDQILAIQPAVGWSLLSMLLPKHNDSLFGTTERPRWKDFGDLPAESRSEQGKQIYVSKIVQRALEHVGFDPERWAVLLDSLQVLKESERKQATALLSAVSQAPMPENVRSQLWSTLRGFIAEHRRFPDAHWVLPRKTLDDLETILAGLAPPDSVEQVRWLFDEWMPDLPSTEDDDFDKQQSKINEQRRDAIAKIHNESGFAGIVRLGLECKLPGFVATTAIELLKDVVEVQQLLGIALSKEGGRLLSSQISGAASSRFGAEWRDRLLAEAKGGAWTSSTIADLLLFWPDEPSTWRQVEALGPVVSKEYWKGKRLAIFRASEEQQRYEIENLIRVGRAVEALDNVALNSKHTPSDILLRLFDAAISQLADMRTKEEVQRSGLTSHDISRILSELRSRSDIAKDDVARREYMALPLLSYRDDRGLALHDFMAENPAFFVEVVCAVFLPASRDKAKDEKSTDEESARARAAYRLLDSMHKLPGLESNGAISESVLADWIAAVRKLGHEQDRAIVTDQQIGHLLAHAPSDPEDGAWPHHAVRTVLEQFCDRQIKRGLMIERHNMRGVYSKSLHEGGAQERDLAAQYRAWAQVSRSKWPCITEVLEEISRDWEEAARKEDIRAEQEKLEL
jgi:hypothetical protein